MLDPLDGPPGRGAPACSAVPGACRRGEPGHALTRWRTGLLARTPWGWRWGSVLDVHGSWLTVACAEVPHLQPSGLVRAWHHRPLAGVLGEGAPVRVHERHGALDCGAMTLSVLVTEGLGAPADPVDLEAWAAGRLGEVVGISSPEVRAPSL